MVSYETENKPGSFQECHPCGSDLPSPKAPRARSVCFLGTLVLPGEGPPVWGSALIVIVIQPALASLSSACCCLRP